MTITSSAVRAPSGWRDVALGYLTAIDYGHPFKSENFTTDETAVPVIRIRDVLRNGVRTYAQGERPHPGAWVDNGDIVIGMDGDFNHVRWQGGRAALNQRVCVLRPNRDMDARFLGYAIGQPLSFINETTHYTTVKHLSLEDLRDQHIWVPSLEVQRRVAGMLDAETARIDTLITKDDRVLSLLDMRRAALLEDRIYRRSDAILTPLQYLCDPARPIRYGIVLPGPDVDDGVPLIKGGDVHSHTLHRGTQCRVDAEIERAHARSRVRQGDLVYAIRGSFGDVDMVPGDLDGANTTQDVARIAPRAVDGRWLLHALRAPSTLSQAKRSSRGATISGVNIESLRAFVLPVPSAGTQVEVRRSLDRDVARLDELRTKVEQQQQLLRTRRQALITAAVTGQITV